MVYIFIKKKFIRFEKKKKNSEKLPPRILFCAGGQQPQKCFFYQYSFELFVFGEKKFIY